MRPKTAPAPLMSTSRASHLIQLDPDVPGSIQLLPAGEFAGRDGRGPYRNLNPAAVIAAFAEWGMPLLIDYHHQTRDARDRSGPVPAAGWARTLREQNGEIWADVEWTARAKEAIQQKELRFISPVFDYDRKTGEVIRVIEAALLNDPNLYLRAVAARDDLEEPHLDLKPLAEKLGLEHAATLDDIASAVGALLEKSGKAETTITELHARLSADPDPARYVPREQFDAVAGELAGLQRSAHQAKVDTLVTTAMQAGKIPPALETWARAYAGRDPDGFAEYVKDAPVIAAGGPSVSGNPPAAGSQSGGSPELDAADLAARAVAYQGRMQRETGQSVSIVEAVRAVSGGEK